MLNTLSNLGKGLRNQKWLWIAIFLVLIGSLTLWWLNREEDVSQAYKTAQAERGPLLAVVAASGTLNPVSQVQVGTQISGQIKDVLADFNSEVKQGQIIARIDPETYEYKVRQAQADLEAAQAQALTQQAEVARVKVTLQDAQRDFERKESLLQQNFISPTERDKAFFLRNSTREQVNVAEAQAKQAQAAVAQRKAALASAQVDLGRTIIRSPVDGVVVKRSIEPGQTVAASLQSPELFIIARNLHDMQVETAIDEADVGRIRPGQKATFTVDAFAGRTFEGEVRQVRKAALNVQNVITYTVIVSASNPNNLLLPGMTANARIQTDSREHVLKIPNAALRFRPPADSDNKEDKSKAENKSDAKNSGGDRGQQFRERLTKELQLTEEQQRQVEPIFAKLREKMQAVRDLPEAERGKASERNRSEMRAAIRALLNPDQQRKYDELIAEQAGRNSQGGGRGRVYVLEAGKLKPLNVQLGISDGSSTEVVKVLEGILQEGQEVVIGLAPKSKEGKKPTRSPF